MKKVARLRMPQDGVFLEENGATATKPGGEHSVRTTGRIKKPKAVFDPSDNYLSRAQRANIANATLPIKTPNRDSLTAQAPITDRRISQTPSTSSSAEYMCAVCLKKEFKRGSNNKNKLITCVECDKKVHKLCLKFDLDDFDGLRPNYKCEDCRSCEVCGAFDDNGGKIDKDLVTCAKCLKSYHLTCHVPNISTYQQSQRNWKCNKCYVPVIENGNIQNGNIQNGNFKQTTPQQNQNVNIASTAAEAKNAALKRSQQELKIGNITNGTIETNALSRQGGEKKRSKRDDSNSLDSSGTSSAMAANRYSPSDPIDIPDVKRWSVDEVADFIGKYFPNEAHVFRDHEIDGMSLLLLKRGDIIKKLPIKLGPSLRIYSLILKIQTQVNDPTLGWNCEV